MANMIPQHHEDKSLSGLGESCAWAMGPNSLAGVRHLAVRDDYATKAESAKINANGKLPWRLPQHQVRPPNDLSLDHPRPR
ncbi:hypothetical protein CC1G_14648 [Coprinopsis cinerea okayama7|uniref:Uncharacterized protein n=1 Tax=Coprinopsis cinerea (strain Okayama-7 / 130 / ATCC MYA-4618 / FGSC 9003) TaxID=240176 RepID=D6RMI6_COPC7|nr:hypothetical protein CC1G_14648 [Coprinopsis cinerea okayama7\|eukprot:XP_002911219.1 hypothetical protein CC1G_14648 [Coprinopsis cinerea okayama7\